MIIWLMIIGMALVTYIPRALPAVLMDKMRFNQSFEKFLSLIPYTAMTALIFPGILSVDPDHGITGLIGGLAALGLAWLKCPIGVIVIGAVLVNMLLYTYL